MKPPPGPMFRFQAQAQTQAGWARPATARRTTTTARPVTRVPVNRGSRTVSAAVALVVGLVLAGAALLAPYAGVTADPAPAVTISAPGGP